jgi:hypothetical protein
VAPAVAGDQLGFALEIALDVDLVDALAHDPELGLLGGGGALGAQVQDGEYVVVVEALADVPFFDLGLVYLLPVCGDEV